MASKSTRLLVPEEKLKLELRPWPRLLKTLPQINNNQQMTLTSNSIPKFSKEPQARELTLIMNTFHLMKTISWFLPLTLWILAGKQMSASFRNIMPTTVAIVMHHSSWPKPPLKTKLMKPNKREKHSFLVMERPSKALLSKPNNSKRNINLLTKSQMQNCQRTSIGETSVATISPISTEIKDTVDHATPSLLLKLPNQDLRSNMVKISHSYHHNTSWCVTIWTRVVTEDGHTSMVSSVKMDISSPKSAPHIRVKPKVTLAATMLNVNHTPRLIAPTSSVKAMVTLLRRKSWETSLETVQ